MAKALYGHLAADPALAAEVRRLRRRVSELEADLARLRAEHEVLVPLVTDDEIIALAPQAQPALT